MTERLNNDQIIRRITDENSDLKRYLDLAPGIKLTPSQPKPPSETSQRTILPSFFPRPTRRP